MENNADPDQKAPEGAILNNISKSKVETKESFGTPRAI